MEAAAKARHGPNHHFVPFNALGIKVYDCSGKPGYNFHSDGNVMHFAISNDPYPQHLIPASQNLRVWTSTFMRQSIMGKPLKVTWVDDPELQHIVASVGILNDSTHIQGI